MKPSIACGAALLLAAVAGTPAVADQLANGSFAQGPPTNGFSTVAKGQKLIPHWLIAKNSVDYVTTTWMQPPGATASIDLNGSPTSADESNDQPGQMQQSFPTTPGTAYTMAFMFSGNPQCDNGTRTMVVKLAGHATRFVWNVAKEQNSFNDMKWTPEAIAFTATAATTAVAFKSLTATGFCGPAIALVSVN